ncbi:MAG: hypothetical protein SCK28_05390 [Bacillota bacterium]|nr:hypothetical protein [Bacillota bacterium]
MKSWSFSERFAMKISRLAEIISRAENIKPSLFENCPDMAGNLAKLVEISHKDKAKE